ncbi:MAG: PIN domain-containing protein [Chloroflexota bacterium]
MTVFVDTSAWYAALDADDEYHARARRVFAGLRESGERLVTHNYVVVESVALMDRRLHKTDVARFVAGLLPAADIEWIQPSLHDVALAAYLDARSRASLVDHVSFALMRARGITTAFAFDADFAAQGFASIS